jgi:hypothetical protein
MQHWPEADRRSLIELARITYLEFCYAGKKGWEEHDPVVSALWRACKEVGRTTAAWQADDVMARLFNRFYSRSREGYLDPQEWLRWNLGHGWADARYLGGELTKLAVFRAMFGWRFSLLDPPADNAGVPDATNTATSY